MSEQDRRGDGEGTIERRGLRVYAKVRKSDGTRPRVPLGKNLSDEKARAKLDAFLKRGRETGKLDAMIDRLLEKNERTKRGQLASQGKLITVREIGEAWLSGELFSKHGAVNGLRPVRTGPNTNSSNALATLEKRAFSIRTRGPNGPKFGDLPVTEVQSDPDIAAIFARQPPAGAHQAAAGTRNHLHSYLSRILSLAEIPLGLRKPGTNPVLPAYRAPKDPSKLYNHLYPPEVLALLGNVDIPLGRRVLYLLSAYFGWRKGTLFAFTWDGVNWNDGTVSVLHQKGYQRLDAADGDLHGTPIFFRVEPACVLSVLRAWWEHSGSPEGDEEPVIRDLRGAPRAGDERRLGRPRQFEETWELEHDEAEVLRRDLKASGVTRQILFAQSKNVQAIRFHDGRATFCTWARRAGKSDLWITERTGHTPTSQMLARYTRMAQMIADLDYQPFPCVLHAIPELAPRDAVCPSCASLRSTSRSTNAISTIWNVIPGPRNSPFESVWCEGRDSNPHRSYPTSTSS